MLHNAPRVELYSEVEAEQGRQDAVDLLEEERDLCRFHARNVRGRAFQEGDDSLTSTRRINELWRCPLIDSM